MHQLMFVEKRKSDGEELRKYIKLIEYAANVPLGSKASNNPQL